MLPLWHQSKEYEDGNSANKGEVQQGTEVKPKETQSTDDSERLYSKRKTSSDIAVWALNIHSWSIFSPRL